jgi:biopolymer transport protein ExbD
MDEQEFNSLNVIPLVDVMLVLLTIVLTTSTFIASGVIPVDLPKASQTAAEVMESQVIAIDGQKQMYLNALPVTLSDLRSALKKIDRMTPILIRADRTVVLQAFVDVLDLVKHLGFTHIRLQTEARR